jgi:hypothetical protein
VTSTQVIVLALLVAAFVSGWVARGADTGRRPAGADGDATVDAANREQTPTREANDEHEPGLALDRRLAAAGAALQAVVDAWIDRHDPADLLERFERSRADLRDAAAAHDDAALRDADDALAEAAEIFAALRAGLPLTAQASKRLEGIEDRLAQAAETRPARRD